MSIEDDISEFSDVEARCLGLMSTLVGACAGQYEVSATQKCIELLAKYPHLLVAMVGAAQAFAEDKTHDLERKLLHPGPSGVVSDLPADEDKS